MSGRDVRKKTGSGRRGILQKRKIVVEEELVEEKRMGKGREDAKRTHKQIKRFIEVGRGAQQAELDVIYEQMLQENVK